MNQSPHDPNPTELDRAIRSLLIEPDGVTAARKEHSFARGLKRMRGDERSTARRRWIGPRLVAAAAVGVGLLVVVALAPSWNGNGSSTRIPELTSDASAAEALRWAGSVIAAEGDPAVGNGSVWHAVAVTTKDGAVSRVREQWLGTTDRTWEERDVSEASELGIDEGRRAIVDWRSAWVSSFDGDVQRGRGYRKPSASKPWEVPGMYFQSDVPGGMDVTTPMIGGPPPKVISRLVGGKQVPVNDPAPDASKLRPLYISATVSKEEGTRRWVEAAATSQDPEDLRRATEIFLRTTRGHFIGLANDANPRARRTTTIKQLIHLLTIARSSPAAARVLYAEFAQMDDLKRLPDVEIDGKPAMRIQYDFVDLSGTREGELGGPAFERSLLDDTEAVLVIDKETGAPLRTESLDRTIWTELVPAERVRAVGDDAVICHEFFKDKVPCDALEGEGPLAEQADARAAGRQGQQFAEQYGGGDVRNQPNYASISRMRPMKLDSDGLPLDDPNEPLGFAESQWGQRIPIYPLAELPND